MLPTRQDIAQRAYEIWVAEGRVEGCEQDHWLRAEREVWQERVREAQPAHRAS